MEYAVSLLSVIKIFFFFSYFNAIILFQDDEKIFDAVKKDGNYAVLTTENSNLNEEFSIFSKKKTNPEISPELKSVNSPTEKKKKKSYPIHPGKLSRIKMKVNIFLGYHLNRFFQYFLCSKKD